MHRIYRSVALVMILLLVVACSDEFRTPGEALRLTGSLPDAVINEPYSGQIQASGGLRPYLFELANGANLPGGLTLSHGRIEGTPTEVGTSTFSVNVSDGNLSQIFKEYTLRVIQPPPPVLAYRPPNTEIRGSVTLHVRMSDARNIQGAQSIVRFDADLFAFDAESVDQRNGKVLFTEVEPGVVQFDYVALGKAITGEATVFSFTVDALVEDATLQLRSETTFYARGVDANTFTITSTTNREGRADNPQRRSAQ